MTEELSALMLGGGGGTTPAPRPKLPKPTLQKLGADDEIEHFLSTFERIAKQQSWPKETWATQLAGLLTRKAMAAYAAVGTDDAADYEKVKTAILHQYEVNEETYNIQTMIPAGRTRRSLRSHIVPGCAGWQITSTGGCKDR